MSWGKWTKKNYYFDEDTFDLVHLASYILKKFYLMFVLIYVPFKSVQFDPYLQNL